MEQSDQEIQFPVQCQYKIICEDREGIQSAVEKVFLAADLPVTFKTGNRSDGGKYLTLNADVLIRSLERMRSIDRSLRQISGVKFIL